MMRLNMIPGTSTDWRMYYPQLQEFKDQIIIPEWISPLSNDETLAEYAKRLLATMDLKEPYMIGGVSLGGMLAQELALLCKPKALILIATCSDSKAIPLKWRIAGRITKKLPDIIVKKWLKLLSKIVPPFLTKDEVERKNYRDMLSEISPKLVKWQGYAAVRWKLKGGLTCPIFQIHGRKDGIILFKRIRSSNVIKDGGHFISVTHADEVNMFIKSILNH